MKVPAFLVANVAEVNNGLLNVAGGGWSNYTCAEFPGTVAGSICGILELDGSERAALPLTVLSIEDGSGNEMFKLARVSVLAPDGDGPIALPFAANFSFVADDVMLADFVLTSGGYEIARISIPVRGAG